MFRNPSAVHRSALACLPASPSFVTVTFRTRVQLVARIDTHLRSRDGWMAENKRSNDLLGQVLLAHETLKQGHEQE